MKNRPSIPEHVKRKLRKEVGFGCAICGNPLITYHHIIPLEEKIHNNPRDMVVLCENHHRLADNGTVKRSKLYVHKKNPFNKDNTKDRFIFESKIPGVVFGSVMIFFIRNLINFDGKVVLSMNIRPTGFLQLDADIYDIDGKHIASIKNNEWIAYIEDIWDISYRGKMLKIWNRKRKVGFQIIYDPEKDLVHITGRFCYNNRSVRISKENGVVLEQTNTRFHELAVVGPGKGLKVMGGTIFKITFPAKNLMYVPIKNKVSPKNTVFSYKPTKKVCVVDKRTGKIHLASCRYVTSQIKLDYAKKKVYPNGMIVIPNKPRPSTLIDYDSITKAEKDSYIKCKICF